MTTVVVNRVRGDVYIGRKSHGMHFGNPFSHKAGTLATVRVRTLKEALGRFRSWLAGTTDRGVEPERRLWILKNLHTLKDKRLECFCFPKPCHGDVYVEIVDGK